MAKKPIKKNSLHNVVVRKISLVDRPANQGATVLLYKRDEETEETMSDPQKTPNEAAEALAKTEAQLEEANETIGELTDALNEVNRLLTKRNDEETEIQKRIEALEEENEQLRKAAAATAGDDEPWAALDGLIQKGDNPLLEKALQAIRKNHEDLAKQLAEAEEVKKRQAEKAEEAEAIRKAADEFKRLPTKPEELGPLLMRVEKGMTTQDDATEVRRLLKAADAVIGSGVGASNLFKELGSGGAQTGSALDQINAEAGEIMKADAKISRETAINKVLEKRPELYTAYQQEKRAAQ